MYQKSQTCGLTLAFSRCMTQPDIRDDELGPTSHGELDLTPTGARMLRRSAPHRLGRAHPTEVDAAVREFVMELRDATSRRSRCFWRPSGSWPRPAFDRAIRRRSRRWSSSDSPAGISSRDRVKHRALFQLERRRRVQRLGRHFMKGDVVLPLEHPPQPPRILEQNQRIPSAS